MTTAPRRRQLHLNLFILGSDDAGGGWRHPLAAAAQLESPRLMLDLARLAERATMDSIFLADGLAIGEALEESYAVAYEPLTMLAAMAAVTRRVGLIGTASTSYTEPYNLARLFASLDNISGGRAGWNIVTTASLRSAQNFGQDVLEDHDRRYERATEYVEVVRRLWTSWDHDALIRDRAAGRFTDAARVREINHAGKNFRVRGPLNIIRCPQGYPLLAQAGSSEAGKSFAARHGEVIFTAQHTIKDAQAFYRNVKTRAARYGRPPHALVVLPGLMPIIGSTEAEARRLRAELAELVSPRPLLRQMSKVLDVDLTSHPLSAPLPPLPPTEAVATYQSRAKLLRDMAERENLTLGGILRRIGGARGHHIACGTPEQVADGIEDWFEHGAADGFNVFPPILPASAEIFAAEVVPELRRRGLFRTEYTGQTLRDHYGIPRPAPLRG